MLVPIVMIIGADRCVWPCLNEVFIYHTSIGVIYSAAVILAAAAGAGDPLWICFPVVGNPLLYASGFLLLTWQRQRKSAIALGALGVFLYGLTGVLLASRRTVVESLLLGACLGATFRQRAWPGARSAIVTVGVLTIMVAAVVFLASTPLHEPFRDEVIRFLEKTPADSRSDVWAEFVDDLSAMDWAVGRGAYSFYTSNFWPGIGGLERNGIESGYLTLILKGGIALLAPFLALVVPAALLGLFGSRNCFSWAAGAVILMRLVGMVAHQPPWAGTSYVFFWLAVGMCYNKSASQNLNFLFPASR
ncbi:MAG TPA: hypothetical protein VNA25_30545 [Phycisphaerae bacterium]|nr:hypothetical protein [Phycisphaerae bacterium]